jgi:small subunit ribosomal protein S4
MGDPKFSKRKYEKPSHPWEGERIKAENELLMKYGLKNKRELWRAQSFIRTLRAQSRELQARLRTGDKQAEIETKELLQRCGRLALLPPEGTTLNDVLALNTEAVLQRRFQTVIYRKGLAYTPRTDEYTMATSVVVK